MIIQLLLTIALAGIALLVGLQRAVSRLVRALILAVVCAGAFFVWVPEQTNAIAQGVGVGRGADLVLYLWVVITLALILVLYLKVTQISRQITQLTRAIALTQAEPDQTDPTRR